MSRWRLILRNLRFYWRTHLGVAAGAAVATAVLVGALAVGDSVRHTLRSMALARLGDTQLGVSTGERYFTTALVDRLREGLEVPAAGVLDLAGVATLPGTEQRANAIRILGVNEAFWEVGGVEPPVESLAPDQVVLNDRLAGHLGAETGDAVVLRFMRPSALSRDIPLGSEAEETVSVRLTVAAVVGGPQFGRFSLQAAQIPPMNAFVNRAMLQERAEVPGRVNTLLTGARPDAEPPSVDRANELLEQQWRLADAEAELRHLEEQGVWELRSRRVFLDPPLVEAARRAGGEARRYLTYFVYELRAGQERATPYSIVAGVSPRPGDELVDETLEDDRVVVTRWLADDLEAEVGDEVTVEYPLMEGSRSVERDRATFRIASIVETEPKGGDRHLMPVFPGLAGVQIPLDWQPPPELGIDLSRIRSKDERYWDEHQGAPKAFVTLDWARAHWSNRFGDLTSIRWEAEAVDGEVLAERIRSEMPPVAMGLFFRPVRAEALAASGEGTDFGGLFLGLSCFLMVAALLLTALLFAFGVEQRCTEVGTLRATGFTAGQVRGLWLLEGGLLALVGAAAGLGLGIAYTQAVLWALTTVWRDAVAATALQYHASATTLLAGAAVGVIVSVLAMAWVLRRQARQPVRALLAARFGLESGGRSGRTGIPWGLGGSGVLIAAALTAVAAALGSEQAPVWVFFLAGALLLAGGLGLCGALLRRSGRTAAAGRRISLSRLGWRNGARRPGRSLATVSMLACGCFLIISINAFRHDPTEAPLARDSGTGGFALWAESTLAVHQDLNTPEGREAFLLDEQVLEDVAFVPMRLRGGDDASCLSLQRPQSPPLLGVDPAALAERDAFVFVGRMDGRAADHPWHLLGRADDAPDEPVPAIVDASVAQWILQKRLGDTIRYTDDRGEPFEVQIVGTLTDSVLQGHLVISEAQFARRFPSLSGYQRFLIDADPQHAAAVREELEWGLQDVGLSTMGAAERLALFTAVQNTYLTIFGVLGGLGLVLGCIGLGLVVLRNVLERRGELALMRSVGFTRPALRWLVLSEHWVLLALGLAVGGTAAALAVVPALVRPGVDVSALPILLTLAAVVASGLIWTALAAGAALQGRLIDALRHDE